MFLLALVHDEPLAMHRERLPSPAERRSPGCRARLPSSKHFASRRWQLSATRGRRGSGSGDLVQTGYSRAYDYFDRRADFFASKGRITAFTRAMAISGRVPANKNVRSLNRERITGPTVPAIRQSLALPVTPGRPELVVETM
jgi:hypothetical protein